MKSDKKGKSPAQISYTRRPEFELATDKLAFLRSEKFADIHFQHIQPDKKQNWLNITENDWDELTPVARKESKTSDGAKEPKAIFKLFSLGVVTNRDEWVYDDGKNDLTKKVNFLIDIYNQEVDKLSGKGKTKSNLAEEVDKSIKWTRAVKQDLAKGTKYTFDNKFIKRGLYRPFIKRHLYFNSDLNEMQYRLPEIFAGDNLVICFTDASSSKPFISLVSNQIPDLHLVGAGAGTQCLPLFRYSESGKRVENVTDWSLNKFQKKYKDKQITKEDIFHYVYAVLHHPAYRAKYEINLKREFPRIPFYEDTSTSLSASFWQWAEWGKQLMDLHLNYESVEPYKLVRKDKEQENPTVRLMAREEKGLIEVDTMTTLEGIPADAWEYRLGTYSALGWILERYKEKKPRDPTIREKFNTYKFADYKEQVIDLLCRVCTVSVETMKIVKEMPK